MNKPNYEAIGRCTVLEQRINNTIENLRNMWMAVSLSEPSYFVKGVLTLDHSVAERVEGIAKNYRNLLIEITKMAQEHNEYAPSAGVDVIDIKITGDLYNNKKAAVSANTAAGTRQSSEWNEEVNSELLKSINEAGY